MPRVLVIRGGAIGDFILTLPAIQLIRENIPAAHLEILGYTPIIDLAKASGLADATRHLEHSSMARLFVPNATLDEALRTYFRSFNLIVSYLFDPDGYVKGNMEAIGVKTFLAASHRVEPGKGHAAEQLAKPLESLAFYLDDPAPKLNLSSVSNVLVQKPIIAVHVGSGSLKKNWPVEQWLHAGKELAARFPQAQLALITGEAELERGITQQIKDGWQGLDYLHWDQLPLTELGARLSSATTFVGHDSGISHLAAACGLPSLLFFGPTDPLTWAPKNAGVEIFLQPGGDLAQLDAGRALATMFEFISHNLEKKA